MNNPKNVSHVFMFYLRDFLQFPLCPPLWEPSVVTPVCVLSGCQTSLTSRDYTGGLSPNCTPEYAPPEVNLGGSPTEASDIWGDRGAQAEEVQE